MLDVKNSIDNLEWTTTHHLAHIQNQHPFMRRWAVQFELAYTDFRVIQMALQMDASTTNCWPISVRRTRPFTTTSLPLPATGWKALTNNTVASWTNTQTRSTILKI
nr:hypothetical protein [Lacticaseibacillus camelliae]